MAKPAKVSTLFVGGTVRVLSRKLSELATRSPDLSLIPTQDFDGFLFRARNLVL
jgi:hypothetical protein